MPNPGQNATLSRAPGRPAPRLEGAGLATHCAELGALQRLPATNQISLPAPARLTERAQPLSYSVTSNDSSEDGYELGAVQAGPAPGTSLPVLMMTQEAGSVPILQMGRWDLQLGPLLKATSWVVMKPDLLKPKLP